MQRHDSQERMEAGSLRAATPSAPLESSPSSYSLRSAKRRRVSPSGSPSTSQGSIVTAISLGATDTFDGRSNTGYKHWLQAMQPTDATPEYASFIDEKVAAEEDGVWTTEKCSASIKAFYLPGRACCPPTASCPTKVSPFRLCGRITLTRSVIFSVCCLI